MQPFRQIINDAPPSFQLPVELHHKRLEMRNPEYTGHLIRK